MKQNTSNIVKNFVTSNNITTKINIKRLYKVFIINLSKI